MSLTNRNGNWHYRFHAAGRRWSGNTELAATERNRNAALLKEAEAYKLATEGKGQRLRLEAKPFSDAADQFVTWAQGEHRDRPGTWKRLRGSMASLKEFFKMLPLHSITIGQVLDYMSWRRGMAIKEVSLRHDLHALSPLFQYGIAHNWCRDNPITSANLKLHGTKMPSDGDAIRMHVLTPAEELLYFQTCLQPPAEITISSKPHSQVRSGKHVAIAGYRYTKTIAHDYRNLHDVGMLMLLQGPRPAEVMAARVEHVDLDSGTWLIPKSKSAAGKRTLRLCAEARSILARRIADAPKSGWLFEGKKPGAHLVDVEASHQAVLATTGLAFVLYDFRHAFATRFYEATRDVEALRKVLGHSNLRTIQKYVHVSQDHVDAAMKMYELKRCQFGANASTENGKPAQTSANQQLPVSSTIQ